MVFAARVFSATMLLFTILTVVAREVGAMRPRSGVLAFASDREQHNSLYLLDLSIPLLQRVTAQKDFVGYYGPTWSPDGQQLVFTMRHDLDLQLYRMGWQGGTTQVLTDALFDSHSAVWSPDGQRIVFVSYVRTNVDIYVMASNGSLKRRLTESRAVDETPIWSPDGDKIAFVSNRDGNAEVYVMNADGSDQRPVTQHAAQDRALAWSPDGRYLAFASDRNAEGDFEAYVLDANCIDQPPSCEASVRPLTWHYGRVWELVWSPDGQQVALMSDHSGDRELYLMDAGCIERGDCEANIQRLTWNYGDDRGPAWRP